MQFTSPSALFPELSVHYISYIKTRRERQTHIVAFPHPSPTSPAIIYPLQRRPAPALHNVPQKRPPPPLRALLHKTHPLHPIPQSRKPPAPLALPENRHQTKRPALLVRKPSFPGGVPAQMAAGVGSAAGVACDVCGL